MSGMNSIGPCQVTQKWISPTPSRSRTELEDGKKGKKMKIRLAHVLELACGSIPKQQCRYDQKTWRIISKFHSITVAVNNTWDVPYGTHAWRQQGSMELQESHTMKSLHYDIDVPCVMQ